MRLRPGAKYYEREDVTVTVRDKRSGATGYVTRACPAGNHIPACAHVMFGDDESGFHGLWVAAKDLERVA
jgi:hypothetical protein